MKYRRWRLRSSGRSGILSIYFKRAEVNICLPVASGLVQCYLATNFCGAL